MSHHIIHDVNRQRCWEGSQQNNNKNECFAKSTMSSSSQQQHTSTMLPQKPPVAKSLRSSSALSWPQPVTSANSDTVTVAVINLAYTGTPTASRCSTGIELRGRGHGWTQ